MEKSIRHHYVPIFYAKHFANSNANLFVLNEDNPKGSIREGPPKSVFFEDRRNSFPGQDGLDNDTIEQIYSDLDNLFAPVLTRVIETGQLVVEDLRMLLFLAYIMKWRSPQYDNAFEIAKESLSVDDLGLRLRERGIVLDVDLEKVFRSDELQETKRFLFAAQAFRFKDDYSRIFKNSFLLGSPVPALLGECPFNEYSLNSDTIFEDFIFPISTNYTLIYSSRIDKHKFSKVLDRPTYQRYIRLLSHSKDTASFHLSSKYIACSDKEHLFEMKEKYNELVNMGKNMSLCGLAPFHILHNYENLTLPPT